jgi:poly-gamma-glutamate synthesis protein (capsule biosynthesis protein)
MAIRNNPTIPLVLLMHWNYELEIYPQPLHRELAYAAIDAGAAGVIGCHSHCVQGIEVYRGAPIVYGLGNWFLPEGRVFGRDLRFPDFAHRQLAFAWKPGEQDMLCHWFRYDRNTSALEFEFSESMVGSEILKEMTPFRGMSGEDYVSWFGDHRRKRLLLPVYKGIHATFTNRLKDVWVACRHRLLLFIQFFGLKGKLR